MRTQPILTAIVSLMLFPSHLAFANHGSGPGSSHASKSGTISAATQVTPNIAFCEIVKNPRLYFDKVVRVIATLHLATEASYLSDDKCVLSHDDQIGVRYVSSDEKQRDLLNNKIRKVRDIEYGGRARVTVVGILRNSSRRSFAWYRYRFDVHNVEDLAPVIIPYEGRLQGGTTYSAAVRGDNDSGLSLVIPLRMVLHVGARIEWTNLKEFPSLAELGVSSQQRIVFTVISDQTKQMTELRWNRTVECKILGVKE